jgi:hypothetical protein
VSFVICFPHADLQFESVTVAAALGGRNGGGNAFACGAEGACGARAMTLQQQI